ncbi:MAG: VOC family protein [Propionibacteriales bacterium]|nr:VOC family protein [Propionibacteriales bacterium]
MTPSAVVDHLVLAASALAQGIEYVADLTGATPRPGGKHAGMGTHNALVKLGEQVYLEVIAIDPDADQPTRRRWFDLDDGDLRADLADRPRLIHWVARVTDLDSAAKHADYEPGPILPFVRGDYRWRITVPDDGTRPGQGVLPTLIEWQLPHPADELPESGVSVEQLTATHPEPLFVRRSLDRLGLGDDIQVTSGPARLEVGLRTPRGLVTL